MSKINLWLDDERDPKYWSPNIDYVWVKTASEAIELLKRGLVEYASLDHDLGFTVSGLGEKGPDGMTGYDVCLFLEQNPEYYPEWGVSVHSLNPVGKQRMKVALDRAQRAKINL